MYEGVVTGPNGTISGDPYALQQLGLALLTASASADFASRLRVDELGPLNPREAPTPDLTDQSPEQAAAYEGWTNTMLVWGSAGDQVFPVEPDDWTGGEDGTAIALVDDFTDLHLTGGQLYARSRCRHDHVHTQPLKHPDDLTAVRRAAEECSGDEDSTA
jgi:hypothetical protein